MENYFEKYAGEIRQLQQQLRGMEAELERLRSRGGESAYDSGSGLLGRYRHLNRQLFRKLVDMARSPGTYFKVIKGVVVFPARAAWQIGTVFNRKLVRPYFAYYGSLYWFELKLRLRKVIQPLRARKKQRVGLFIPTLGALAGAERFTIRLASAISRNFPDVEVDLIATNILSSSPTLYDIPSVKEIESKFNTRLEGVNIRFFPLRYRNTHDVWEYNFRKVATATKEYSLFINCQHNLYPSQAAKSVFLCHFPHRPLSDLKPDIPRRLSKQIERLFSSSYESYLSNSTFTAEWLLRYWPGIAPEKLSLLHPPVLSESLRLQSFPGKEKIIMTCGRIDPEKKILELANIFIASKEKLEGYRFYIVGTSYPDDPELKAYYQRVVELARRHQEIEIFENIPFSQLLELYRKASIYWHAMGYQVDRENDPIRLEHFGISVVEAMSQGCIPIVHRSGGASRIVAEAGLDSLWNDPDEVLTHTLKLLNDPGLDDLRMKLVKESSRYSEEAFELQFLELVQKHKLIASNTN